MQAVFAGLDMEADLCLHRRIIWNERLLWMLRYESWKPSYFITWMYDREVLFRLTNRWQVKLECGFEEPTETSSGKERFWYRTGTK